LVTYKTKESNRGVHRFYKNLGATSKL